MRKLKFGIKNKTWRRRSSSRQSSCWSGGDWGREKAWILHRWFCERLLIPGIWESSGKCFSRGRKFGQVWRSFDGLYIGNVVVIGNFRTFTKRLPALCPTKLRPCHWNSFPVKFNCLNYPLNIYIYICKRLSDNEIKIFDS